VVKVNLYTTLGCHLCEQAHGLLLNLQQEGLSLEISSIEIADSDELMERYGIRIPVVEVSGESRELGWPFNLNELRTFLV
jgi:hypothetical protein